MLFLIGMPGSGKTYWARRLADYSGWNPVDMDVLIEAATGYSVPDYFRLYGEAAFREKEAEILQQIIADAPEETIVSCGGGTPCFFDNLDRMKDAGCVIYLRTDDVAWLFRNLAGELHLRPLLQHHPEPQAYLAALLEKRQFFYEQADIITDVSTLSMPTFAQIFDSCTNPR